MKIYVVSKSSTRGFALDPDNIIEVCATGPDAHGDARVYAKDYALMEGDPAFIFAVELTPVGSYKTKREAVFVAPAI